MKYTRFNDIPRFIADGHYEIDFTFDGLHREIVKMQDPKYYAGVSGPLNLNPDFQRAHVWTKSQQVAWLEFHLAGGKTGRTVYLNDPNWHSRNTGEYNDFVIVDGKQRVEAIRRFMEGEIKVHGSRYDEYTDSPRMCVVTMKLNINSLRTKADVLRWYLQFNAGGTPHTKKEIERVRQILAATPSPAAVQAKGSE